MVQVTLFRSTIKLFVVAVIAFIVSVYYSYEKAQPLYTYHIGFLAVTILLFTLLIAFRKKVSQEFIGSAYLLEVFILIYSFAINHQYLLEHFEKFQPFVGVKILALFIALSASPKQWVGWSSLAALTFAPLIQYYSWPENYQSQIGIQEPALTICFLIVAGALYSHRLFILKLVNVEIIASEKIAILQRLRAITSGLKHLNNTPMQTIGISLELLKEQCPNSLSLVETAERAYNSVCQINKLLDIGGATNIQKSATTLEELEIDLREIDKYLKS